MAQQMPAVLKNFNVRIDGDSHAGCEQLNKIYTNLPIYYYNR